MLSSKGSSGTCIPDGRFMTFLQCACTAHVRTGAGEQPRVDLVDVVPAAHDGAEVLTILREGDGATLGQFEALPHALHAHGDIAAVGEGREGIGRLDAGLLPAQPVP